MATPPDRAGEGATPPADLRIGPAAAGNGTGGGAAAAEATWLDVRVQPGARRPGVTGTWNGCLRVAVRAPARDGRANAEALQVIAEAFALRPAGLVLVRGARARVKTVQLPLAVGEARRRLLALLA